MTWQQTPHGSSAEGSGVSRIDGPLYYEVAGRPDAPPMLFVHPNPLDSSCWMYQMAHFSTWYRCIAVDLPGYGRSPGAQTGLTMAHLADACWAVVREVSPRSVVLVGCSVGSYIVQHMYHQRPVDVDAVVLCGAGWRPTKTFPARRIAGYREHGIEYRYSYALEDLSADFRDTAMARWFATMTTERNDTSHVESIIAMFEALAEPDPAGLQHDLRAPVLVITGTEDPTHPAASALVERLPDAELVAIQGAGHACQFEQPWAFDAEMMRFLGNHGLPPA